MIEQYSGLAISKRAGDYAVTFKGLIGFPPMLALIADAKEAMERGEIPRLPADTVAPLDKRVEFVRALCDHWKKSLGDDKVGLLRVEHLYPEGFEFGLFLMTTDFEPKFWEGPLGLTVEIRKVA